MAAHPCLSPLEGAACPLQCVQLNCHHGQGPSILLHVGRCSELLQLCQQPHRPPQLGRVVLLRRLRRLLLQFLPSMGSLIAFADVKIGLEPGLGQVLQSPSVRPGLGAELVALIRARQTSVPTFDYLRRTACLLLQAQLGCLPAAGSRVGSLGHPEPIVAS